MAVKVVFTNRFLFVSINVFVEVAASVTNISCITQVTLKFINYTLLVNSGWLYFQNFKVFVEFSADEYRLNGGLNFWAEVCEMFFHYIRRDLIFEWYDNSDGGCSRVGWWNVLLVSYLGIYKLLDSQIAMPWKWCHDDTKTSAFNVKRRKYHNNNHNMQISMEERQMSLLKFRFGLKWFINRTRNQLTVYEAAVPTNREKTLKLA